MEKISVDTIKSSFGGQQDIKKELPIPNKIISPFTIKPTIVFYEPYEIMIKETTKYLQETNLTESDLLAKYDIDYNSFFSSDIRDEKGFPENLTSNHDVHLFLLDYINIPKKELICDSCNTQIIPLENKCDFCDRKMCETCQMNSYYSFHYCNECGTNYCYYNGLGNDYKCLKAKYSGHCFDCGF